MLPNGKVIAATATPAQPQVLIPSLIASAVFGERLPEPERDISASLSTAENIVPSKVSSSKPRTRLNNPMTVHGTNALKMDGGCGWVWLAATVNCLA
ncbi:MAG: hypothetical protein BZY87_02315 [SAR202 cluster bacterium Io17-Chloro-G6]|nr:MAG: hypothetical protein BZY87_02315 [SAR202 cluster bacterium Io17-Chloro-G6]